MAFSMQALLATQARSIGVRSRTLRRQQRPTLRTVAAAAAEPDVAEPVAAEAAEAAPAQQERKKGGIRARGKRVLGPARTMAAADVVQGQWYEGTVVSVMEFGAFVNIGANTDGLLHISQISSAFVKNVGDAVKVGDVVKVRVTNVDLEKGKFAVSLIDLEQQQAEAAGADGAVTAERMPAPRQARREKAPRRERRKIPVKQGDTVTGKVASVSSFGAFVEVGEGVTGLLHESEMVLPEGVNDWREAVKEGQEVQVFVSGVQGEKIQLSMRSSEESAAHKEAMAAGMESVTAPEGSGSLGHSLARAGISASLFKSVGAKQ